MSPRVRLSRHTAVIVGITLLLFLPVSLAGASLSIRRQAALGEDARLHTVSVMLAQRYLACLRSGTPAHEAVSEAPDGIRLSILDAEGMTIADSQFAASAVPQRSDDEEVRRALDGGTGIATTYRMESGQRERIACVVVHVSGSATAFALASSPSDIVWSLASNTIRRLALWTLLAAAACCALFLFLLRFASRPLAELADAVENRSVSALAGLAMRADATDLGRATKATHSLMQENRALSEREQSLSVLFETVTGALRQAVAVVDASSHIVSANGTFRHMFGKTDRSLVGASFTETVVLPQCLAALESCRHDHEQHAVIEEGRGRTYSCSVRELESEQGEKGEFLILVEDVTEAIALPRMKSDFVANASHELKTPLTAIRGYLDLLHEEPGNMHYLTIIERNVDRLINLSSDVSLLSRLENQAPAVEDVDMQELQRDLSELFEKKSGETGVPLVFTIDAEARRVHVDRLMILQLFINLIENAYRFTAVGNITVSAVVDPTHVIFAVADTGKGIMPQDLPHVFDRFFSRSDDRGRMGSGLGLAIVKRIVLAHNGSIDVHSTPGRGSSFVIRIPRNLGYAHAGAPEKRPGPDKEDS